MTHTLEPLRVFNTGCLLSSAAVLVSGRKLWEVPTAPLTPPANSTTKLIWAPHCDTQLRHLQDGGRIAALIPPRLEGTCEVRPGPEFLTRSYTFYPNRLFKALQFYYADSGCQKPDYSLVVRGKLRLRQASWITRGGTEAEHHLQKVGIVFHGPSAARRLAARLPPACRCGPAACWVPGRLYELHGAKAGPDCLGELGFSMMELDLLRVETQHHPHGQLVQELFLGDIHTEWTQRTHYRPSGYQQPLQNAMHHIHPCLVCALVYRATEQSPPVLPATPTPPLSLDGRWVSQQCEVRPAVLFLTRDFTFHEDQHTWEGVYQHYSDPACHQPTFRVHASGRYTRGASSPKVPGGTDFVFKVTQAKVTVQEKVTARVLNSSEEGTCGLGRAWEEGVEQDITPTHGCAALGIKLPHKEYELFRMELDHRKRPLLFIGERPTDGSSPDRPQKRPTSYQAPLAHCSGRGSRSHHHDQHSTFAFQSSVSGAPQYPALWVLVTLLGGCYVTAT
ncbi:hypothetical protein Z043_106315 [Scleropages formosus]|uniref:APCDD1 domain-containing protein n=1 Tax=Scleropages formosus TaxID=113540 RepID=A0A0P7UWS3_SCLFO|nr:hypothetical protein Z043_106315 [Scleropages formosus]